MLLFVRSKSEALSLSLSSSSSEACPGCLVGCAWWRCWLLRLLRCKLLAVCLPHWPVVPTFSCCAQCWMKCGCLMQAVKCKHLCTTEKQLMSCMHQLFWGWLLLHPINGQLLIVIELPAVPQRTWNSRSCGYRPSPHHSFIDVSHAQQRSAAGENKLLKPCLTWSTAGSA